MEKFCQEKYAVLTLKNRDNIILYCKYCILVDFNTVDDIQLSCYSAIDYDNLNYYLPVTIFAISTRLYEYIIQFLIERQPKNYSKLKNKHTRKKPE